jgi:hypothetical protein
MQGKRVAQVAVHMLLVVWATPLFDLPLKVTTVELELLAAIME